MSPKQRRDLSGIIALGAFVVFALVATAIFVAGGGAVTVILRLAAAIGVLFVAFAMAVYVGSPPS